MRDHGGPGPLIRGEPVRWRRNPVRTLARKQPPVAIRSLDLGSGGSLGETGFGVGWSWLDGGSVEAVK